MKKSLLQEYSKIKREFESYKKFKEEIGLSSSNYTDIKEIRKNLKQSTLVKKNE